MPSGLVRVRQFGVMAFCPIIMPFVVAMAATHFLLHDRRPEINAFKRFTGIVASLSAAYGEAIVPRMFSTQFSACCPQLRTRAVSPKTLRMSFPMFLSRRNHAMFQDAVRVGREIRAVETFAREPAKPIVDPDFVRVATEPRGALARGRICSMAR